jgi:catechol 2,3-dioxygenase-like lactoylglutathione lyase family enzyme
MRIRLRQVALVARDLAATEKAIIEALGLELCYRDPGVATFGLHNALFPIGDKLLEVISPTEDGTTAGRLLDKRGGDGGYMVIFEIDDLDQMRRQLDEAGARVVFEATIEGITGLHLHPRDVGGAIVSVDQVHEWGEWPWAGPDWKQHVRTDVVRGISHVDIQANDPSAMATRWSEVLGRPAQNNSIALDEGTIRFVPVADDRGEGISAVELLGAGKAGETREIDICGCRFRIAGA